MVADVAQGKGSRCIEEGERGCFYLCETMREGNGNGQNRTAIKGLGNPYSFH
jgi:hypothetical protein